MNFCSIWKKDIPSKLPLDHLSLVGHLLRCKSAYLEVRVTKSLPWRTFFPSLYERTPYLHFYSNPPAHGWRQPHVCCAMYPLFCRKFITVSSWPPVSVSFHVMRLATYLSTWSRWKRSFTGDVSYMICPPWYNQFSFNCNTDYLIVSFCYSNLVYWHHAQDHLYDVPGWHSTC